MSKITVEFSFTVRPATGPNVNNRRLEIIDDDGYRYDYANSESDAVEKVRTLADDVGIASPEIDLDGRVQ